MSEDAIIVAIVFGSILGMIAIPMLINLAKKWIDRNNNNYDEQAFDRLAKAFVQHKKDTERRLQNLEAIVSEEGSNSSSGTSNESKQIGAPKQPIEIEDRETEEETQQNNDTNLRNMLRE